MKKVIGIIVASSVLLSAGSIYANVDAASKLSNWYENQFQEESSKLGAETISGLLKTYLHVNNFKNESKHSIERTLASFIEDRVKDSTSEIERFKEENENLLNQTVSELKEENFDDYAENANFEEELDQSIEEILKEVLEEQESNAQDET